jgi:uncharacterized membrane protein YeiH
MAWDVFNIIGTIAFALSGAIIAMEAKYDIIGTFFLGLTTAFGGGAIRNLFIGIPITELWQQTSLFTVAIMTICMIIILPKQTIERLQKWSLFDSIGLSAFAVQGALLAHSVDMPILAVMFSAAITGAGGGIIRDILAQRKPIVFREEIYLLWAVIAGFIIGMEWAVKFHHLYILFGVILVLRVTSHKYGWRLPSKSFIETNEGQ